MEGGGVTLKVNPFLIILGEETISNQTEICLTLNPKIHIPNDDDDTQNILTR